MRLLLVACCGAVGLLAAPHVSLGRQPPAGDYRELPRNRVSAPVYYSNQMLVLTTKRGVAAVAFDESFVEGDRTGVKYRYRFRPAGGGIEPVGSGELFERTRDPNVKNDFLTWRTVIRAGPIDEVIWSRGSKDKGWVYYVPESVRVQYVSAKGHVADPTGPGLIDVEELGRLDLSRFEK